MPRHALSAALLLLATASTPAFAEQCAHSAPRSLDLDLSGVKTVKFEVGANRLRLDATPGADGALAGRACAASAALLDGLTLTQYRDGDRLVVSLGRDRPLRISLGSSYSYLDIAGSVPDDVLVQLDVGSGEAYLAGASAASADVGSGEAGLRRIRGRATVKVGSGDIDIDDAGALKVLSIGSGEVEVRNLRGDAEVGSIGSGDFKLKRGAGSVSIDSIGSGDAALADVAGSVRVGSIGSGDLDVQGLGGDLVVDSLGSGDIDHGGVRGAVDVPRKKR